MAKPIDPIYEEINTIFLEAKSLGLFLLPQKRINIKSARSWAEMSCNLLHKLRSFTVLEEEDHSENYFSLTHEIVRNLEKVADYFQELGDDCHAKFDFAIAHAYWLQIGSFCNLDKADFYYRRSGFPVELVHSRGSRRIFNLIGVAEHYLDGIGVRQDISYAETLFVKAGGLDAFVEMDDDDILRICCRLYEYGLAGAPRNLGQAAKLAVGLWRLGYLSSGSEYFRLREYESLGGFGEKDLEIITGEINRIIKSHASPPSESINTVNQFNRPWLIPLGIRTTTLGKWK